MPRCPHCQAELETPLACAACGHVLPVADAVTPFEIFGIPLAYAVDREDLRRRLVRFGRLVHPDFFGLASQAERELAEQSSARLNEAFALLSDDAARADWLLTRLGGPDEATVREMPRAFLMEVLDWNETLEAVRARPGSTESTAALQSLGPELDARRARALASVAQKLTPLPKDAAVLAEVRQELNALRYLARALSEIESLRTGEPARR